jgi:2-dehydropantoate 2-reductase
VWRDLAVRRRKTEVDGIFGPSLERAERLGLPLPLTRRMIALIHDIEDGRRPMAWANLDELVTLHHGR